MNKKILLVLLVVLFVPTLVSAACDYDKHKQYTDLVPNITYDNNYSKSSNTFNIVIYSMFSDMFVTYNGKKITPNENNEVAINNIKPGSNVLIRIYASDGCDEIKVINLNEDYFNSYYGTEVCEGYETTVKACSSQFTTSPVTRELIEEAKNNLKPIPQTTKKPEAPENDSIFAKIKTFIETWGIKIVLVVVTTFIVSSIYNDKFRKIKHGI